MAKIPVEVTFETITPLWTGDAWGEMHEIRPSSLIGSLRFWFEVLMYFGGVLQNADKGSFEKELNSEDYKEFRKKLWEQRDNSIETKLHILAQELNFPISSIIFGTTGWRSLIEISKVNFDPNLIKQEPRGRILRGKNWFFGSPSYQGNFSIKFLVEEFILESIFYPLLNFMHHYGYWGGKWNIGYGRLRILNISQKDKQNRIQININEYENFNVNQFTSTTEQKEQEVQKNKSNDSFLYWKKHVDIKRINFKDYEVLKTVLNAEKFYCNTEKSLEGKFKKIPTKILILEFVENANPTIFDVIKNLLRNKIKVRNCLRHICESTFKNCFEDKKFLKEKIIKCRKKNKTLTFKCERLRQILNEWKKYRHQLLGERGEGSKILPYISLDGKYGFLSIAGLLNLQQNNQRGEV